MRKQPQTFSEAADNLEREFRSLGRAIWQGWIETARFLPGRFQNEPFWTLVLYTGLLLTAAGVAYITGPGGAWSIFGVACLLAGAWFVVTAWRGADK